MKSALLRIRFYKRPIYESFRRRWAKVGEIVTLDFEEPFTGYEDDEKIVNFILNSGEDPDEVLDEPVNTNSYTSVPLLSKSRKQKNKQAKETDSCCCCTIN